MGQKKLASSRPLTKSYPQVGFRPSAPVRAAPGREQLRNDGVGATCRAECGSRLGFDLERNWCEERDLNPHALSGTSPQTSKRQNQILKRECGITVNFAFSLFFCLTSRFNQIVHVVQETTHFKAKIVPGVFPGKKLLSVRLRMPRRMKLGSSPSDWQGPVK